VDRKEMEIYTLIIRLPLYSRLTCNHEWERVIEIPATHSLYDLHLYIQEIVEFDNDHAYLFFAGRSHTNKKILYSDGPATPYESGNYGNISLNEVYPMKGLKLYYIFDFGDNWVFEIKKMRKKKRALENIQYPRVIDSLGANPDQYRDWAC
jgi:hypothetical protein